MEQEKSVDEEVKGMLSALQKCDDEVKAQAALPKKVNWRDTLWRMKS